MTINLVCLKPNTDGREPQISEIQAKISASFKGTRPESGDSGEDTTILSVISRIKLLWLMNDGTSS